MVLANLVMLAFALGGLFTERSPAKSLSYYKEKWLPSPGYDYTGYKENVHQILKAQIRALHPKAKYYLWFSGKGPRLDASDAIANVSQDRSIVTLELSHTVNRSLKGDSIPLARAHSHNAYEKDILFSIIEGQWIRKTFVHIDIDRARFLLASLQDQPHQAIQNEFRVLKQNQRQNARTHQGLYYGELMSKSERQKEKVCLAQAIYFEARGEPLKGQLAVAQVVMNRVRESYYPETICKVIYEGSHRRNRCQFSFACDGRSDIARNKQLWDSSLHLAKSVINGKIWLQDIGFANHYHANYVRPRWAKYMDRVQRIGAHIFYLGTLPSETVIANSEGEY
ncbi:MAG: cell wall hydrolase [Pseudomonadota bacterium]